MSHFMVLVIGDDVEKQLQPYHEYECTGIEDEYVKDVDVTEELESELESKVGAIKLVDGSIHNKYDEEFWNDKIFLLPEGAVELEITQRELLTATGQSIESYAEDYGGWVLKEGRYYNRTNPNKKWDWWVTGGRWTGFLKLKEGVEKYGVGKPGLMTPRAEKGFADVARKRDVDFVGMMDIAGDKAGLHWDKAQALTGGKKWESWDSVRERLPIEEAREFYNGQEAILALRKDRDFIWDIDHDLTKSRAEYCAKARNGACIPYAFVKDSVWHARGEMGWFGISSGDMDKEAWNVQFVKMLVELPEDTLLTVVDCHI